jgi:hypothetical protein
MAITYSNIFHPKALQIVPKLVFLVLKYTIWQLWPKGCKNQPRISMMSTDPERNEPEKLVVEQQLSEEVGARKSRVDRNVSRKVVLQEILAVMRNRFFKISPGVDVMITIFCNFCQFSAKKLAFISKKKC